MASIQTLDVNDTTHLTIPSGTLTERPSNQVGMVRVNSTLGVLEYSNGTNWVDAQSGEIPYVKNGLVCDFNTTLPQSCAGEGWYDISGNGAFATPTNSPNYEGGYFVYNGVNQSHAITKGLPAITGQISVEMWVFLDSITFSSVPVHKGYHFSLQITGENTYKWADSSDYYYENYGSRIATGIGTTGVWKQIVVTKDTSNTVRVYVNATLADTRTNFGGPLTDPGTTLWFGGYSDTDTAPTVELFYGSVAITRIYNRQLTNAEITQNYLSSLPTFSNLPAFPNFIATGGTITIAGGYKIHTFSSSGNFVVTQGIRLVEYLIVAGGGGGGLGRTTSPSGAGGGGGGGGVQFTSGILTPGTYAAVVGNGGYTAANGKNSSFNGIVSIGGGGAAYKATPGGSGAGGSYGFAGAAGTAGQGNNGGSSARGGSGGGGGGAGAAGAPGITTNGPGGKGGDGVLLSVDGTLKYYGGGGGGGFAGSTISGVGGAGGLGGGGAGAPYSLATPGGQGTDGLGGGGGGAQFVPGYAGIPGRGGNGIVIIRYTI